MKTRFSIAIQLLVIISGFLFILLGPSITAQAASLPTTTHEYYFESQVPGGWDWNWGPYSRTAAGDVIIQDLGMDPYFDGYSAVGSSFVDASSYGYFAGDLGASMSDGYLLVESTGTSASFTNNPGFQISFDYNFSIDSDNSQSYGLVEFNLFDVTTSQSVANFQIESNTDDAGTRTGTFNNLNPQHEYLYDIRSLAYSYINASDTPRAGPNGDYWSSTVTTEVSLIDALVIPEPATIFLLGGGLAGLAVIRKKYNKK